MSCVFLPLVLRLPRLPMAGTPTLRRSVLLGLLAAVATLAGRPTLAAAPAGLAGGGVATVPADASFLFSSLRLKEQYDAILASNAFAAIRELPAVKRAFDSWEEQREMPGSPVSMFLTFLELPENEQAVELLTDMRRHLSPGSPTVGLTGGVFQNALLVEIACTRLPRQCSACARTHGLGEAGQSRAERGGIPDSSSRISSQERLSVKASSPVSVEAMTSRLRCCSVRIFSSTVPRVISL